MYIYDVIYTSTCDVNNIFQMGQVHLKEELVIIHLYDDKKYLLYIGQMLFYSDLKYKVDL